ncbi:unnamed protein product [Cochlearia groenlandica]
MADFGFLSDTDDSAVEELVSQAKELSALEQVAAINCSAFTDPTLPDDLESRFRRLKSLPSSSSSNNTKKKHLVESHHRRNQGKISGSLSLSDEDSIVFSGNKSDLDLKSEKSSRAGLVASDENGDSRAKTPLKHNKKLPKEKRRIVSSSSPSSSVDIASPPPLSSSDSKSKAKPKSWFDKLSPSKIMGSIWPSSSSNKLSAEEKKKKKNMKSVKSFSGRERELDFDEFLSDLNAFSVEDQRKMLKKALKEQQRMRKEAAEIIKLTKKASAKFDFDD